MKKSPRTERIDVRLSPAERRALEALARKASLPVASYVRHMLLGVADEPLRHGGGPGELR